MARLIHNQSWKFLFLCLCISSALHLPFLQQQCTAIMVANTVGGWTMYMGDAARTGFADTYISSQVEIKWERCQSAISLTSVVSDGVYAYLTSPNGNVTAISAESNATFWEFDAGRVIATPLIVDNFLVVGNADGGLYFFERYTGYLHQTVFIGHGCTHHMLYWNNTIFAAGENWLTALDIEGRILWSLYFENEISAPPLAYLKNIYIITENHITCLNQNFTTWKREFSANLTSATAASGNIMAATEDGKIIAVDALSGETKWEVDLSCEAFSPAYYNGILFAATRNGTLYAISTLDGLELWNFSTGFGSYLSPVVNRYNILFASGSTLYCLKQCTGELVWSLDFDANLCGALSLVSSIVFVADSCGRIYCISAPKPDLKVSANPTQLTLYERTQMQISFSVSAGIMPAMNAGVSLSVPTGTLSNYSGSTDTNGIFTVVYTAPAVRVMENFTLSAVFSFPGYRNTTKNLTIAVLPTPCVQINLSLDREIIYSGSTVNINLTVLRAGNPVHGAPVYVWCSNEIIAEGYTDLNGSFGFTYTVPDVQEEAKIEFEARVYGTASVPFLEKTANLSLVVVPYPHKNNGASQQIYASLAISAALLAFFSLWNLWDWRKNKP